MNLVTGDPGGTSVEDRKYRKRTNNGRGYVNTYIGTNGTNPDKYRSGVAYIGVGPIRFGRNSENIRHALQNKLAHDRLLKGKAKWFRVLDIEPTTYWYFGSGYGNGLW